MNSSNGTFNYWHNIFSANLSKNIHHIHGGGSPPHHRPLHFNLGDHLDLFYNAKNGEEAVTHIGTHHHHSELNDAAMIMLGADDDCHYEGTDYLEVKILLIGVFASGIALLSFMLNAFLVLVFAQNPKLRRSPLFYFGVLAMLDLALALLYLALMAVPVYMDQFRWLWLYHLFLRYLRPMLALSNIAMFASVLMILLATIERLLLTFSGKKINKARRLLERHRPQVTLFVVSIAAAYKLCTYFEIEVFESANCTGFEQFEVVSAVHENASNPMFTLFGWDNYKFWWMFVTRNLVDHIFPFFLLVILNFHIIRALRRERLRATNQHLTDMLCSSAAPSLVTAAPSKSNNKDGSDRSRRGSVRSLRESLRCKVRLRNRLQKVSAGTAEDQAQKKNLRAATRALVSVVSMYLMSKVLQVAVTFFETFASEELIMEANFGEFRPLYSYVNDAISILTLMSSALRFPIYCACNKPMLIASRATLERILRSRRAAIETLAKRRRKWKNSMTMERGDDTFEDSGKCCCCSVGRNYERRRLTFRSRSGNDLLATLTNGNGQSPNGHLLLMNGKILNEDEKKMNNNAVGEIRSGKRRVLRLIQRINNNKNKGSGNTTSLREEENVNVNHDDEMRGRMLATPESSDGTEKANGEMDDDYLELFC